MRYPRLRVLIATMGATLVAFGCHHAAPVTTPATAVRPPANQDSIARENARRDSIARADAARRLAAARADSIRRANDARNAAIAARETLTDAIHFEFDRADILDPDRAVMDRKAAIMKANPSVRLRIDGNTDERGSDEYNLALGMRRAAAAKRYLTDRGVDASRIETASNGEERPVCQDHDEICWTQNRRDTFSITGGGDAIVAAVP